MRRLIIILCALLLLAAGHDRIPGWSTGQVAAGTATALSEVEPLPITLPDAIAARVTGPTILFYYSPTCPHCQQVMPEINALVARTELPLIGISAGSATQGQVDEFARTYEATFETILDADRGFAMAVGARSTPNVYIVRPRVVDPDAPVDPLTYNTAPRPFEVTEGYSPFARGMGAVLLMRQSAEPFAHFDGYVGDVVCSTCHEQEALSWAITHHAQAYYTLYVRERVEESKCVRCHVTGMGEEGGFKMGDHLSPMTSVTCEACHGPSGPHDGERADASASCEGCHDADHSVAFSLEKGLPHIDHFAANDLTNEELRDRVEAIARGEGERPLLAFPEGPTVGAAACKSCHASEHRALKRAPHARAMRRLVGADAENVGCVRCHATPAASGPPADDLAGYRVDEGVGCESCHGPGTDHIAAPSADNIIGLGESCPECVIEAICTSCHTPVWDEDWELSGHLERIGH
jgi:thiol-disulfide isomerase/thioredoxin